MSRLTEKPASCPTARIAVLLALILCLPALLRAQTNQNAPEATSPTPAPAVGVTSNEQAASVQPTAPMAMQTPQELPATADRTSYNSVNVDGPFIAMTFDDGPSAVLTPQLLDILKQRNIKATFFVLGQLAQEHPEIIARAVAEGHEIANHSWDHKALNKLGEGGLKHELSDTSEAISKVTGKPVILMRPPYGATNARLNKAFEKEYGMKVILWSVDPLDWRRPGPQVVSQRILAGTKPGAIILAHDIHPGTIEAMPTTFDALLAKGYKFVTVSELLAMESKNPAPAPSASPAPAAQGHSKGKTKKKAA